MVTIKQKTVPFTQFTSSALKNKPGGKALFGLGFAFNSVRQLEYGWMEAPKSMGRPRTRISDILLASPTVLTEEEKGEAGIQEMPDISIVNLPIRPTEPANGPFLHTDPNLGQLVLSPNGQATLRFYGANNSDPFATYTLQLSEVLR